MNKIRINGKYVFHTSANKIQFGISEYNLITICNSSSGGVDRGFIIEGNGWLVVSADQTITEQEVGTYKEFYFKALK